MSVMYLVCCVLLVFSVLLFLFMMCLCSLFIKLMLYPFFIDCVVFIVIVPVSYTHLDVYKRQVLNNIEYRTFTCETYLFIFPNAFRRGVRLRQQFETDWPVTCNGFCLEGLVVVVCGGRGLARGSKLLLFVSWPKLPYRQC